MFHGVGFDAGAGERLEEKVLRERLDSLLAIKRGSAGLSTREPASTRKRPRAYSLEIADVEIPPGTPVMAIGVYFTAGDPTAARAARAARKLVATVRARESLGGVQVDMLVASASDEGEHYAPGGLEPPPLFVARSGGSSGGTLTSADGTSSRWGAAPLPGPPMDAYGAGDSFAACVTYGLAGGLEAADALALAARCGAANMTGRGPYEGQLRASDLGIVPQGDNRSPRNW